MVLKTGLEEKKNSRLIDGFADYDEEYFTKDLKAKFEVVGKKPETQVFSNKTDAIKWLEDNMKKHDKC